MMSNQLLSLEPRYRVILPEVATTTIIQVGVGGTGSWLAMSLARLAYHAGQAGQMVKLVLVDPDTVEERNVGRQGFSPAEVGQNKAESMALRLSLALGIEVAAATAPFVTADFVSWANQQCRPYGSDKTRLVLVGAVDNHLARRELAKALAAVGNHTHLAGSGQAHSTSSGRAHSTGSGRVWAVDCGNGRANGQVLVGNLTDPGQIQVDALGVCNGLPSPYLQEPGLLEPDPIDSNPLSCADLTLREEQSLLINSQVAAVAAQYLYDLVIRCTLWQCATYLNLEPPTMSSRLLTPTNLALWGYGRLPAVEEKNEQDNQTTT
jgi:PRTRC genetic system ThiF family protein